MIFMRYYSWVKRDTRNDGSAFLERTYVPEFDNSKDLVPSHNRENNVIDFTPSTKKGVTRKTRNPLNLLVAGAGFEPTTSGL